ncbi:hypothetical protein C8J57DRAFT_946709, partial [Mycena rebaudengoi]
LEDMTHLRTDELRALRPDEVVILAWRVSDPLEDRVLEAVEMGKHSEELTGQGFDRTAITLEDSLKSDLPPLNSQLKGSSQFINDVRTGYSNDPVFAKILGSPTAYVQCKVDDGLIYTHNIAGAWCLGIPRAAQLQGRRTLTEIVPDEAHSTLGHLGEQKTAEYARRWYWW